MVPAHLILLAGMVGFAVGIVALRRRRDLAVGMARLVNLVAVIASVAAVAMIVNASWGLAIAALALAGIWALTVGVMGFRRKA